MIIDQFVFASYERFLLYQFHVQTTGLYFYNGYYLIHCPEISSESVSADGIELHEWFRMNKIISANVFLTETLPDGAIRLDEEVKEDDIRLSGYLITRQDVRNEIDLLIPKIYPDYTISFTDEGAVISFSEEVTEDGFKELENIFKRENFQSKYKFENNKKKVEQTPDSIFPLLSNSRNLGSSLTGKLKYAWENDEDSWLENRKVLLSNQKISVTEFRKESLRSPELRCLVDCSIPGFQDIRNYLSLYLQIGIIIPDKIRMDSFYKDLNITKAELVELIGMDKVHIFLPGSIEVYDHSLLENIIEIRPENVHLTRSINSMVIGDLRNRNPFFFPSLNTSERRSMLSVVSDYLQENIEDQGLLKILEKGLAETGIHWVAIGSLANQMGLHQISQYGIVNLLSKVFDYHLKKDTKIDFMLAAPAVNLAAATRSVLIPSAVPGYNLVPQSQILANIYSGIQDDNWISGKPLEANFIAEGLLTVGDKVPVIEFAKTFNGSEITRLNNLVTSITKHHNTPEDMEEIIGTYNHFVRQYEKDSKYLKVWEITGNILSGFANAKGLPLPKWLISKALKMFQQKNPLNVGISSIMDSIESQIVGTIPDAILVSRMKNKLKDKI